MGSPSDCPPFGQRMIVFFVSVAAHRNHIDSLLALVAFITRVLTPVPPCSSLPRIEPVFVFFLESAFLLCSSFFFYESSSQIPLFSILYMISCKSSSMFLPPVVFGKKNRRLLSLLWGCNCFYSEIRVPNLSKTRYSFTFAQPTFCFAFHWHTPFFDSIGIAFTLH